MRCAMRVLTCLAVSAAVFAVRVAWAAEADATRLQSLAGPWSIRLDPDRRGVQEKWYADPLPPGPATQSGQGALPGSAEQRGFGVKTSASAVGKLTRLRTFEGPIWYQREIVIPDAWRDRRVELFLERCHWESTVWLDDRRIGTENSLSVPHVYSLGVLSPGRHRLTLCVDNTYKLPIGAWSHALTEESQGNWNGAIGRIELWATAPVWIRSVQVYPESLKISVGNATGKAVEATVQGVRCTIPVGGGMVETPFTDPHPPWDEFAPVCRTVTATLEAGPFRDTKKVGYGTRRLGIKDRQFVLNGRPIFMRGAVDECVYPLTGYPPMDKESWLRVLRICQSYGFNFMRFHSWCPPEAAFAAADELGFLFQVELPLWTAGAPAFGQHPPRDEWLRDELLRILDAYGNHPSFAFMAMGNESTGTLHSLVQVGRKADSRRLYRCEGGDTQADGDYFEIGQRGVVGPRTDWDRWTNSFGWIAGGGQPRQPTDVPVPTFSHEVGQWAMYPDFDEIKKYTGTLRADNLEQGRQSLAANHMLDQARDFQRASGRFSVLLYKDEIEASLRTWPYGGLQILEARDYPGHGNAIVGWLDPFWDSKGLIAPEEFRRFCAPTVCLLRMARRVLTAEDRFTAGAEIAHYGPKGIEVRPEWTIAYADGKPFTRGNWPARSVPTGCVTALGEISASLDKVAAPARLVVTVSAAGTSNSWNIWVYPAKQPPPPANVRIVHAFDRAAREALAAGERVLLYPTAQKTGAAGPEWTVAAADNAGNTVSRPDSPRRFPPIPRDANALRGSFMPTFWSLRLFPQVGTLGILCDSTHPALAEFPTEFHGDWQWADLLGRYTAADSFRFAGALPEMVEPFERLDVAHRSLAVILNETPPDYRPIVQAIDNFDGNWKLGIIFEARVGPGRLLVCAMDLDTDADRRPAARQLRRSLLDYAAGPDFKPAHALPEDLLARLLTDRPTPENNANGKQPAEKGR